MSTRMIARNAPLFQEVDAQRSRELTRAAWRNAGVVCISLADMEAQCGPWMAKQLEICGEQFFGKRKG